MVLKKLARAIFGDPNERDLKHYREVVLEINALEPQMQALRDEDFSQKTEAFRKRLADGETPEDILIEAFALVREASRRTIGLRHYDVQLIGGMVLHDGKIAEMKTGEGKTLVATLPLYLNALSGKGSHLVTPNDYLSKFGLQQMGPVYHKLGLKTAVIQNYANDPSRGSFIFDPTFASDDDRYQYLRPCSRREAYQADITYGTNNEFGFDYLRDNMVRTISETVQRAHHYAIVDEVDNILIDEARTPLIISGMSDQPSPLYEVFARVVKDLKPSTDESIEDKEPDGDYVLDEKSRTVYLTESGIEKVEARLKRQALLQGDSLYSPENSEMIPYLDNSLRALVVFERDKEYMVEKGQVVIVDEFTGRAMYGRRFSEGLHQAIEAKEGVTIQRENLTLATVTFQNYFRMYTKLAGMTGTAMTEADEFLKIYKLDVVSIPTNLPNIRQDFEDLVFMTEGAKWRAIVDDIKGRVEKQQPVLIGTIAIETSERLSKMLDKAKIAHVVLNAKAHEREAQIITQAGRPSTVTIATNMAGRGVDILLGGNPDGLARIKLRDQGIEVTEATPEQFAAALNEAKIECKRDREIVVNAGGLYVLGTERHEARRIDNQLRGRSGRQGDPGESRFYLSLEDDLMRRFGGERVKGLMKTLRMPEDQPIEARLISSSIQQAQVRIEGFNFDLRKRLLEFDDVLNKQREVIYKQRREILEQPNTRDQVEKLIPEQIKALVKEHYVETTAETPPEGAWNPEELYRTALVIFPVPSSIQPDHWLKLDKEDIVEALTQGALEAYTGIEAKINAAYPAIPNAMRQFEREIMLRAIDILWMRHLTDLDVLREGIYLMAYAQRDPLVEYKREAFTMWEELKNQIKENIVKGLFHDGNHLIQAAQQGAAQPAATAAGNTIGARNVKAVQAPVGSFGRGSSDKGALPIRSNEPIKAQNPRESAPEPDRGDIWSRAGRNDPCPCGSGKKFKNCHYPLLREQKALVNHEEVKQAPPTRRKR